MRTKNNFAPFNLKQRIHNLVPLKFVSVFKSCQVQLDILAFVFKWMIHDNSLYLCIKCCDGLSQDTVSNVTNLLLRFSILISVLLDYKSV